MKKQIFTLGLGLLTAVSAVAQTKRTYTIPTVIHVLNSGFYGGPVITDAQAIAGIANVNQMLQGKKAIDRYSDIVSAYQDKIAGLDVELVLAKKDKNGKAITGIVMENANTTLSDDVANNMNNIGKLSSNTPSGQYLNIYVYNRYNGSTVWQSGVSYRPGEVRNTTTIDGVFICAWAWPATYPLTGLQWPDNGGYGYANVLGHEVGHYLNLIHLHGNVNYPNGAAGCSAVDDLVADTSPVDSDFFGQLPNSSTYDCNNQNLTNMNNLMGYSLDANMLTKGQVQRMEAALKSTTQSRNNLWSYNNLISTGNLTAGASKYCTAAGNSASTAKEWISKVTITDNAAAKVILSKASTGDNRYQDFSSTPVNVTKGKTYTLLVDVNDIYNADNDHDYLAVWFDWNNNGLFENSEKLELWSPLQTVPYLTPTTDATGKTVIQGRNRFITIPTTAATGNVRMRIRTANNDYTGANKSFYAPFSMSPCNTELYGEVEDYTLNIQAATAARTLTAASDNSNLSIYPTLASTELNVNANSDLKILSIDVIDMNGNIIKTIASPEANNNIDVNTLSTGTYLLNIHTEDATYTSKFIKK